jgi:hypothetical protein
VRSLPPPISQTPKPTLAQNLHLTAGNGYYVMCYVSALLSKLARSEAWVTF